MREPIKQPCRFCQDKYVPEDIPIISNADTSRSMCLIVDGPGATKQLVMSINGCAYGIQIEHCPKCGRKLNVWRFA